MIEDLSQEEQDCIRAARWYGATTLWTPGGNDGGRKHLLATVLEKTMETAQDQAFEDLYHAVLAEKKRRMQQLRARR